MKKIIVFAVAALTVSGFLFSGCSEKKYRTKSGEDLTLDEIRNGGAMEAAARQAEREQAERERAGR